MTKALPHEAVFARLGVSGIHGIGAFAIVPIAQGAKIFPNDKWPLVWVEKVALEPEKMSSARARLYRDFGINKDGRIGCPENFDHLTPSWYLNEPVAGQASNVAADGDYNFIARRDIDEGEELTIVYAEFSEPIG